MSFFRRFSLEYRWKWWSYPGIPIFTYIWKIHDDVTKWKLFPRYWPFVWVIHRSPVNSPHKGQWRGALIFSLICVWINDWVNNREAKFMGPTWGPPGSCRPQMGPMLAPWTLLSGMLPWATGVLGRNFVYVQDNATWRPTTAFLTQQNVEVMNWPVWNPDMNFTEHVWDQMGAWVHWWYRPIWRQ